MAQNLNYTNIFFSISPRAYGSLAANSGGYVYDVYGGNTDCYIHSVNAPITLQVWWQNTNLTQAQEGTGSSGERVTGDLVNVVFDIWEHTNSIESSISTSDFRKIATIKKSKDIPKKWNGRVAENPTLSGHRFTIDISDICADLLSYSLVPNNIGTFGGLNDGSTGPQGSSNSSIIPNLFGGLNGQWVMEDVALTATTAAPSMFNLTMNGTERRIRVFAKFEVMKSDGSLEISDSPSTRTISDFSIINSAPQWSDSHNLRSHEMRRYSSSNRFLTNSPNFNTGTSGTGNTIYWKKVDINSQSEYLQWYQRDLPYIATGAISDCDAFALKVDVSSDRNFTSLTDTVYLVDFMQNGRARMAINGKIYRSQYRGFTQNISPDWINKHNNGGNIAESVPSYTANPITTTNKFYRVSIAMRQATGSVVSKPSGYMYYELDLETKGNWKNTLGMQNGVKFMWLNRLGGIDTYTAKWNMTSSLEVSQDVIKKRSPDRKHPKKSDSTVANSSIGANVYPHSREVLNVNANRNYSAYTDPLSPDESRWVEEILTSPNVWIMQETKASAYLQTLSTTNEARPSKLGYTPILITNSNTMLVDEESGLVQINIEFSESHEVNTQRN